MARENEAICGHCAYSQGLSEISILYKHMAHSVPRLISACPEGEGGLCGQEDSNLFLVSKRCFPIGLQTNEIRIQHILSLLLICHIYLWHNSSR